MSSPLFSYLSSSNFLPNSNIKLEILGKTSHGYIALSNKSLAIVSSKLYKLQILHSSIIIPPTNDNNNFLSFYIIYCLCLFQYFSYNSFAVFGLSDPSLFFTGANSSSLFTLNNAISSKNSKASKINDSNL